jgi:hypothetical protein
MIHYPAAHNNPRDYCGDTGRYISRRFHILYMLPRFLVVSKYELRQYRGSAVDQAVILLVILTSFLMLAAPQAGETNLPSSRGIYRIGCPAGSPLLGMSSYTLQFVAYPDEGSMVYASNMGEIDGFAFLSRGRMVVFGSHNAKSDAALSQLNSMIGGFNTRKAVEYIGRDGNLSGILFPVRIQPMMEEIDYDRAMSGDVQAQRNLIFGPSRPPSAPKPPMPAEELLPVGGQAGGEDPSQPYPGASPQGGGLESGSLTLPSDFSVEFPFKSLYKNMTLLSPLILLSILLSLSIAKERIDRNIENLLNSPLTNAEILLGKAFPYLALAFAFSAAFGLYLAPLQEAPKAAFVFMTLSATMISFGLFSSLIARSYRELTFLGSFSMFVFFLFIVLPNVFSGVNVLAFISPLDAVTALENGGTIAWYELTLSMLPYVFLSAFFLSFTASCFNAEVLFSTLGMRGLAAIFYRTLSRLAGNGASYVFLSVALLVPFVFIVESIVAYLVLPLGAFTPLASLALLAAVEELVKVAPYYHRRMNPAAYGILAGASFFLMEKLFNAYLIVKVYSYLGGPYMLFFAKMLPTLILHMASAAVFAYAASRRGRAWFALGLFSSVILHVTYNYAILAGLA